MTSEGVQGFTIDDNSFYAISSLDFFPDIPFYLGDHIRCDSNCNIWITTRHSGVRVILSDSQFSEYWPSYDGLNEENSELLSNVVYDLSFNQIHLNTNILNYLNPLYSLVNL